MRALILLFALTQPPETQVGDFNFRIPGGWGRHDHGDSTFLQSPVTLGRAMTYIVLAATPIGANVDPRAAFAGNWSHIAQGSRVMHGGQIATQRFPGGFLGMYTTGLLVDRSGQQYDVGSVATVYNGRFQTITLVTTDFRPDMHLRGQQEFAAFMQSLHFGATQVSNAPGASGAPTASGGALQHDAAGFYTNATLPRGTGRLDGIYRAVGQTDLVPVGPGGMHTIGAKYMTFFPDARVKEGIIDVGMDNLDEDSQIRLHITGWGTYVMNGDVGTISFARASIYDQTTITWDIHEYPDRLEVHGDSYKKMESGDGVKLSGTFRRADYKTLSAAAQQGITFTPDGRFKDEGIFKAAFVQYRTNDGYAFDDGAPGTGTYRVKHYTLELTYDNGRTKRAVFYLDPSNSASGDVTKFWFNTYFFARVP